MSASDDHNLNDCGCCEGVSTETPALVFNRPGLAALAYRVGTHSQFKETMLARLSGSRQPALQGLNTRSDDDFSIALLDAWATVADVLTFYQERVANESYLRTATERLSILEMARLIGYELRPGLAAGTYLAFTLEDAPGAFGQAINLSNIAQGVPEIPPPIVIGFGVKAQSVPAPGEQAQIFETVEEIEARVEWNAIKPRLTQPQTLSSTMASVVFEGAAINLKPGDKLLIDAADGRKARAVSIVTIDDEAQTTRVDFETPAAAPLTYSRPGGLTKGSPSDFQPNTTLDENAVQAVIAKQWSEEDLSTLAEMQNWPLASFKANIVQQEAQLKFTGGAGVFAFRQRVAIFGYNAPYYSSLLKGDGGFLFPNDWDSSGWEIWKDSITNTYYTDADLYLERNLTGMAEETWIALELSGASSSEYAIYKIGAINEASLAGFGVSGKSTGLRLTKPAGGGLANNVTDKPQKFKVRKTTVHLQSEQLGLAAAPITDVIEGNEITLDNVYFGLKKGQKVVLTGERNDLKGVIESELLTIKEVVIEAGFTVLIFEDSLVHSYVRDSVTINANVAQATHGETVQETLGSGDATLAFQRFTLRQPPLTFVGAATPSGAATTLEVRVNDLLWKEVDDFFGHGPDERIYITKTADDGKTTVIFGDGKTGARLPTGVENIKAKYRKGIGLGGLVKAHQISQLMTRPLGVKAATNPFAAEAAQDPEQLEDARRNAPLTALTLGRVVSLQDYEDFARAFSGVAKALATWSWNGERRCVLLTVAGMLGAVIEKTSDLYKDLLAALRNFGDPHAPLLVESYAPRVFRLAAQLQIAADYLPEVVSAAVETMLREHYSFDAREFGQPVHLSEVIGLVQNVPGVVSVTVTEFYRPDHDSTPVVLQHLPAARPQLDGDTLIAAELLTLDTPPIQLTTQFFVDSEAAQ